MRKRIGVRLTGTTFLVGLLVGAVDARTTHAIVAPARAATKGGGGGGPKSGGCDGHGTQPYCAACSSLGDCLSVCVGGIGCTILPVPGGSGYGHMCAVFGSGCASGGSSGPVNAPK